MPEFEYVPVKCNECNILYYTNNPDNGCEQCKQPVKEITHAEADAVFKESMAKSMFKLKS